MQRRELLTTVGAAGVATLAGCITDSNTPSSETESTEEVGEPDWEEVFDYPAGKVKFEYTTEEGVGYAVAKFTVKNVSDFTIDFGRVNVGVYDIKDKQMDSPSDTFTNWEPGEGAEFTITYSGVETTIDHNYCLIEHIEYEKA